MDMDGIGNLYVLFEKLKKKLQEEGLFDPAHKQKIKRVPRKIGVITAPTGAAVRDIISTINRRFPLTEIYLFPTLVQGDGAKDNIVKMIELANTFDDIDTIILGRGGGSIEDLWAFNEEVVARAIYNSRIPIISGVGHEIDFTISDFVADLRAPTPTGAALMATPDVEEVRRYFVSSKERINNAIINKLDSLTELLKKYKSNYILNNPNVLYDSEKEKINNLKVNLFKNITNILEKNATSINTLKVKLDLLNPDNILDKGYSIVHKDGKIIKNINDLGINDDINIMVKNGNILANVKGVNEK
jgi:exodeoxyribonuclease VII large subunit